MMADDSDDENEKESDSSDEDDQNQEDDVKQASPERGKKVRKSLKGSLVAHGYDEDGAGQAQEMPTVYQDSDEDDDGEVQVEVEDDSNPMLMATLKQGDRNSNGSDDDRSPQEDDNQGFYQEEATFQDPSDEPY